ncbi:general transcription factor 3C polypeptide 5 [Thalassophryne amazonica]|uniref:general transcription factor 3C polypeptide 5 n=1 Tax=Thalassophryne amazonica TaxID=390379 RepID=UPI001470AE02|nr:general transcription factor 3C polypeptide 5 [Thalassophryne amazonica]
MTKSGMAEDSKEFKVDFTLRELDISCQPEEAAVPGSSSAVELRDNRLVCVEYPAVFTSVDKMLETLGGEHTVSKTYTNPNKRLELRYRPQDPFCHCLFGNRLSSTNLLLRVRRRVRKNDPKDAQMHMEILGVIGTTYKFQGLADFQCLAVHSQDGKSTSLYDRIILRKSENQDFFHQSMPYFLPPAIFSRLDSPVDYFYRPDTSHGQASILKKNVIGLNRARRPHNAIFVSFTDATVPSECLGAARANWERISVNDFDKRNEEHVRKMFESRPIWSRNGVKANMNIHPEKLKLLLPVVAYYMLTGPWRSLWVRLGYDPRKTTESKIYQMLDYRIRCNRRDGYTLSDMPVKAKRSSLNYSLQITLNKAVPQVPNVMELPDQQGCQEMIPAKFQLKESSYIFREGMLPPHRQMFYQLCDLDVESIRQVIRQNDGKETECDERDGWCLPGTTYKLRNIISEMVKRVIEANKPKLSKLTRRRQIGQNMDVPERAVDEDQEEDEEEEEDEDDDEFQPSEGSENEMETEMLDYM